MERNANLLLPNKVNGLPQYQDLRNNHGIYVKTLTSRIMAIVAVFKKQTELVDL